jgi:hypothetical protein
MVWITELFDKIEIPLSIFRSLGLAEYVCVGSPLESYHDARAVRYLHCMLLVMECQSLIACGRVQGNKKPPLSSDGWFVTSHGSVYE